MRSTTTDQNIMAGVVYSKIGRIDIRRAWEFGHITDQELVDHYKTLGYNDRDAELMAGLHKSVALEAEIGKVRNEIIADFADGFIDKAQLEADIKAIGTASSVIPYYIDKAELRKKRGFDKLTSKVIIKSFKEGVLSETEAIGRLNDLGLDSEWINLQIELAKLSKKIDADTVKSLTKSEIFKLFNKGMITEEGVIKRLSSMNYSDKDIDLLMELNKA